MTMKINLKNLALILFAILIIIISLLFTTRIANSIAADEEQKMLIWAEATEQISNDDYNDLAFKIIEQNDDIPVVVTDATGNIITSRNFNIPKSNDKESLISELERLKTLHEPIIIHLTDNEMLYVYYDNSRILKQLEYFPLIQLALVVLFLGLLLWIFATEKHLEQDKVWVGLSRETAHQLGTPISSLAAWHELLKGSAPPEIVEDMGKDINRLLSIADRFSKIGSTPCLERQDVALIIDNAINYMRGRTSKSVEYIINNESSDSIVPVCEPLLQWVIENLCKNAVDAMHGEGKISILIINEDRHLVIEFSDTGKGIAKHQFKKIFKPGFTTKQRGWGLGLSLAKRIIEEYHNGKIFVKSSTANIGTTFRIEL